MIKKILATPLKRQTHGKYTVLSKDLYIPCDCSDLKHTARVRFSAELEKVKDKVDDKGNKILYLVVSDDVYFEFNATECIDPEHDFVMHFDSPWDYIKWPFMRYYRRICAAWKILRGKPVYFCSDVLMDTQAAKELAKNIIKTALEFKAEGIPNGYKT